MELYAKLNLSVMDIFGKDTIVSSEIRKCSNVSALKQWLRTYITETIKAYRNQFQSAVQNTEISRKEVVKAIQYINHNYMNEITLDDLASLTNLSRNYFCRIFKEETGEGFVDYLNRIRINKAKLLLSNTDQRIVDIACNVGIRDYRYFCDIFKKFTGSCPSKYRDKQH